MRVSHYKNKNKLIVGILQDGHLAQCTEIIIKKGLNKSSE